MKIGIIRCMQTEDICPGSSDFKAIAARKGAFAEVEGDIELVGFANCGGCPGKRAGSRARLLQARGAEAVFMDSCICKGLPLNFPCPHADKMKELIEKSVPGVKVFDYTH